MANQDELKIRILADISGLKSDMEQAKKAIGGFEEKTAKVAKGFKGSTNGMLLQIKRLRADIGAATFAVSSLTAGVGALIKTQVNAFKETRRWAKMLDISTESLSSLVTVGKRFDVNLDDVASGISDMSLKITDAANGAKPFEEILNKIGLTSKELVKLKPDEQFLRLADALSQADSELRRFALDELGSDPLLRMIGLLEQGSDGIKGMIKDVDDLGLSMSSADFNKMAELSESLTEANIKLDATAKIFVTKIGPALVTMVNLTDQVVKGWGIMADKIMGDELKGLNARADKLAELIAQVKDELDDTKAGKKWFVNVDAETKRVTKQLIILQLEAQKVDNRINELMAGGGSTASAGGAPPAPPKTDQNSFGAKLRQEQLDAILSAEFEHMLAVGELQKKADAEKVARDEENLSYLFEQLMAEGDIKRKAREKEEAEHAAWLDRMFGMDAKHQEENRKLWMSGWQGKMQVASKFMGQMSSMMDSNSRKQFEIGKAAAIAQVAIDTPKAAMSAYSAMSGIPLIGPALGIAAAAAAISSGASQIQNIKSQTMGGGSVNAGGISGGGGAGAGGGQQQAAPENVLDATFNIQGSSVSADSVRQLGSSLNEYIEDGFRIRSVQVV